MALSVLLLPAPFGPMGATISPAFTANEAAHRLDVAVAHAQIAHFEERGHSPSPRYALMTAGSRLTSAGVPCAMTRPKGVRVVSRADPTSFTNTFRS